MDELAALSNMPVHRITKNRNYLRQFLRQTRSNPFMSMKFVVSSNKNQDRAMTYASEVTYPYLIVLGEKDVIVNNAVNR